VALSETVRAFLEGIRFGVVASVNADGTPQQSVVWYALRGDRILFNTRRGRLKDRNLRRDPRMSFCVESEYQWVAIAGTVEIVDDQDAAQADMLEITRRYKPPDEAEREHRELYARQQRVSIFLTPEKIVTYGFDGHD
jgi:PPOX class probable F420-dependent enzyme